MIFTCKEVEKLKKKIYNKLTGGGDTGVGSWWVVLGAPGYPQPGGAASGAPSCQNDSTILNQRKFRKCKKKFVLCFKFYSTTRQTINFLYCYILLF